MTETFELTSRTSVTFKTGEKYKESLINFSGDRQQVRADIIAFFGLVPSECDGRSDYEIRLMADRIAQTVEAIQNKLGGVLATKAEVKATEEAVATGDPWASVGESTPSAPAQAAEPEVDPKVAVLDTIESITTVKDLQRLWSENKALFDQHADVMSAYKAKGKALQAAA